jgi:hypothetical protein
MLHSPFNEPIKVLPGDILIRQTLLCFDNDQWQITFFCEEKKRSELAGNAPHAKIGANEATDETLAQQEGAGENPARFAVDALQGGRATNAQLCRPGLWPCIPCGHISFGQIPLYVSQGRYPLAGRRPVSSP